jgi:hypothetical protein
MFSFLAVPILLKPLENMEIPEKSTCIFEIESSGIPVPSISWSKDKTVLVENEKIKFITEPKSENATIYRLIIENCSVEDSGLYVVKIKNALGEATTQSKLNVLYAPKFVKELQSEYNVKEHDTTKLTTEVNANPKAEINWYKQSTTGELEELISNEKYKSEMQQNSSNLIIKDCLLTDAVLITCAAKNKIGESQSHAKINVSIAPKFLQTPESIKDVEIGQSFSAKCIVRALPSPQVQFIQGTDQNAIENNDLYEIKTNQISETEFEYELTIKNISINTCSSFECKAANNAGETSCKFNLNILTPPNFVKKPDEKIILSTNNDLLLECTVIASPDATIAWLKDGKKLAPSKKIQILENKDDKTKKSIKKSFSLKVVSATNDDAGVYEIIATNKLGEVKCSSQVVVEFSPLVVKDLKPKEKTSEDQTVSLECTIRGNPKPEIKWFYGEQELNAEDANILLTNEEDNYKLTIVKASTKNTGQYKAIAVNSLGQVQTATCVLDVDVGPRIKPLFETSNLTDSEITLYEDENKSIELSFEITGKPEPNVEYFKDGNKFKPSEKRITLLKSEKTYKLNLPEIKASDAGVYKIVAKNSVCETSITINLKVKSAPKIVKGLKNKIEAIENTKVEFVCSIAPGVYPEPQFKWFRGDEEIKEGVANFVMLKDSATSTLIIENIDLSYDSNKFKCVWSNEIGTCESESIIDVLSIPKFTVELNECQPLLNEPFEWIFKIDSHPEPKLKITHTDKEINLSKETRIKLAKETEMVNFREIHSYKLLFSNILAEDLGIYKIEASNKAGISLCQSQLTVIGLPYFVKKPTDSSVVLNKPLRIDCEIGGIPIPEIEWLKDGNQIVENERVKIENKTKTAYILNFKTCTKEDAGTYTIKLSNNSGKNEHSFNISIQGKLVFC